MSVSRAISIIEKAKLVCWFEESKSFPIVAKRFREHFQKEPPSQSEIKGWHKNFLETGAIDRAEGYSEGTCSSGVKNLDETQEKSYISSRNPMV